ncbi:TPA: hypothetical protein MIR47_28045, partial [Klebsiella pneumoniae]|nr:hypothetical protein [Klebsiella pneumoniae]
FSERTGRLPLTVYSIEQKRFIQKSDFFCVQYTFSVKQNILKKEVFRKLYFVGCNKIFSVNPNDSARLKSC